jgi:hypothetical protein
VSTTEDHRVFDASGRDPATIAAPIIASSTPPVGVAKAPAKPADPEKSTSRLKGSLAASAALPRTSRASMAGLPRVGDDDPTEVHRRKT